MIKSIIFTIFFGVTGWDLFGNCYNEFWVEVCPTPENTYLQFYSRKLPLYSSGNPNSPSNYVDSNLVVVPDDNLKCFIYCRNEHGDKVEADYCHPKLFNIITLNGIIQDIVQGVEESSLEFYYLAPQETDNFAVSGGSDTLKAYYGEEADSEGDLITGGSLLIKYPPLLDASASRVDCDYYYIKSNQASNCVIAPKDNGLSEILASPYEFDIEFAQDAESKFGYFDKDAYLTMRANEQIGLDYQYTGGAEYGCNEILVKISGYLPSYNQTGSQIDNSAHQICTVVDKEEGYFSYTVVALPFVLLAIIHTLTSVF